MSTTVLGEPDKGYEDKVRRAKKEPLYGMCVKIWG